MKRNLTPIASGVALFLMGAAMSVQAQEANTAETTVVVTGIRASLQQSLNVKKNAQTHIDVISAEDIGKMPDKNVADSLARVPGITILNSPSGGSGGFDERDRVGLRGTNPSLTQTLLDGHSVANGDWFVLDQTGAGVGRSVSFSLLPSELVSRVEVHKSASASDIEGGTAGNVNIITRKPLEFSKSLTIEASVGAVYADLPKKTDPQVSAMLGWKNDAKTFGILVQVFDEKRHLRRDGVETIALDAQPHAYQAIDPTKETAVKCDPGAGRRALSQPDGLGPVHPGAHAQGRPDQRADQADRRRHRDVDGLLIQDGCEQLQPQLHAGHAVGAAGPERCAG